MQVKLPGREAGRYLAGREVGRCTVYGTCTIIVPRCLVAKS